MNVPGASAILLKSCLVSAGFNFPLAIDVVTFLDNKKVEVMLFNISGIKGG